MPGLSLEDRIPVWLKAVNKTVWVDLAEVRIMVETGGGATAPAIVIGGKLPFIVDDPQVGLNVYGNPNLAGKSFNLYLEGRRMIRIDEATTEEKEFEILSGGGFRLLRTGDTFLKGQRFELDLYELQGGQLVTPAGGGALFSGKAVIAANTTLNPTSHAGKLLQLRGGATALTVTLPLVEDTPENTVFVLESTISNQKQHRISTQGGQFIYLNGGAKASIFLAPGEALWLYRDEDGYYPINEFGRIYRELLQPKAAFEVGMNQVLFAGQEVLRADYPRVWEKVQTFGSSLVSEITWQTPSLVHQGRVIERPYRGCFSTGNGSTTFRFPDFMDMALRGVSSLIGSDPLRAVNVPGGYQEDRMGKVEGLDIDVLNGAGGSSTNPLSNTQGFSGMDNISGLFDGNNHIKIQGGGPQFIMRNIGVLWVANV